MSKPLRGVLLGVVGTLLLLIGIGLLVILTGGYNVAATDRHPALSEWALTTTMRNAVQEAADDIEAPAEFTPAMITAGAGEYKAMCVQCHGGIGEGRAEWAETMRPKPPALAHAAREWSSEEIFWLVKHGVKMSGMPAFGPTHDDRTLWNIAAFVKAMPEMSEQEYAGYAVGHVDPPGAAPHQH